MARKETPQPIITKLEHKFKLMFFLRDLGVKSARLPADTIWRQYMSILEILAVGEIDDI